MRVADRMQRDAGRIDRCDSVARAARMLGRSRSGAIPVVSEDTLVGVVDVHHVARAGPSAVTTLTYGEVEGGLDQIPVHRIAARGLIAVGRRTSLRAAVALMRRRSVPLLPVTRGEEMIGVLTADAMLELLAEMLEPSADRPPVGQRVPRQLGLQARGKIVTHR